LARQVRLLHVFPTFDLGGAQVRTVDLMASLGPGFSHQVAALDGHTAAAERVAPEVEFRLTAAPERANALSSCIRLRRMLLRVKPDLLLTYNWGAIEAAIGARLNTGIPFLHAEDGFGTDEALGLKARRVWTRRVVLRGAAGVVVPSRKLERIALEQYRLPREKVVYIPNGVDTDQFAPRQDAGAKAAFGIDPAAPVIGTVGHLRSEKRLTLLIEAVARLRDAGARLLIVGGGPGLSELQAKAAHWGCAERVVFAGMLADTAPAYAAMDVFAMSSATEQMPIALLEAMASGLPAVCTDVGDCAYMMEQERPPFIVPPGDAGALAGALDRLLGDEELRRETGRANRLIAEKRFSRDEMIERYRELYLWVAGRGPAPEGQA
jgi:glycosyltransferase involved in cell wall biosynthesis